MAVRVQVILDERERSLFRKESARENVSLSAWLRDAGREKLQRVRDQVRIRSLTEMRAFFRSCDRRETGREPDWEQHLSVIERSRKEGGAGT